MQRIRTGAVGTVIVAAFGVLPLAASPWVEFPSNPIYQPYGAALPEDYFPSVLLDANRFNGDGDAFVHKMWHQSPLGIALSYSNDGVSWTLKGETNLIGGFHPCVLYDRNGFGGGGDHYKIWYWTGSPGTTIGVIRFSSSPDGINWAAPQSVAQDPAHPLVDGVLPGYFYHLYGPGFVMYNAAATSTPGQPFTFPYLMFYDTASEGAGPGTSVAQIALAYSGDGIFWTRYGSVPVLIPSGNTTDWDGSHAFRPSVIVLGGRYTMLYSGSNDKIDPATTIQYAHGIGAATSSDGITWTKDAANPVFSYKDNVAWRNSRTYTPAVLRSLDGSCLQMWFVGGTGTLAGANQGIGLATECGLAVTGVPSASRIGLAVLALLLGVLGVRRVWRGSA